jgi:hypothetical protein
MKAFQHLYTMRKKAVLFNSSAVALALAGCATSSPIQRYGESQSHFSNPPELISHNYSATDTYRIYQRASSGFASIQSIRQVVEQRAEDFARRQGKSVVILGERISQPPYILGNFPRIETIFALVDKPHEIGGVTREQDKYAQLEKLAKLLDQGALTREEFEQEKAKILK